MVIKKKSDKNWEYCVYVGQDEEGKKKYKRKCGFKTRKECIKEATELEEEKTRNKEIKKTFKDVCYLLLDDCFRRELKPTTIFTYKTYVKFLTKNFTQINTDIKKIDAGDIYSFINKINLRKNQFKRRILGFMKYIFKYAKAIKLIHSNIFDEIKLPKLTTINRNIWSDQDIKEYIPIFKDFKYYDLFYLVLETGLRRGEVCALTWDCVDLKKNIITINKSYVLLGDFAGISTPKTNSSIRQVVLLDESVKILKRLYKNKISEYVFPNPNNINIPVDPRVVSACFRRFLKRHDIKKIRFHDLRHIHATLLLNKNVNYKILSKRLGHSNVSFTLQTYTHVIPDYEVQLFKNMSKIF